MDKTCNAGLLLPHKHSINCNGKLLDMSQTRVMGILNITPDSFHKASRHSAENVLNSAKKMMRQGADILDIGAYSSRPNAEHIGLEAEWQRLSPALDAIREALPDAIVSVDTFRAEIAVRAKMQYNVDMINDISAGNLDAEMFDAVAQMQLPYIMMHMQGRPQDMQQNTNYRNLMSQIIAYFSERVATLKAKGVHDVIIDPGFGFGKTLEHNYELLSKLEQFKIFEQPLLVGLSRKSMIYNELGKSPQDALNGSTVLHSIAVQKGAKILRVHDVSEAKECIRLVNKTFGCQ